MKTDEKAGLWSGLGFAASILALCLGIGGCSYLMSKGEALKKQNVEAKP